MDLVSRLYIFAVLACLGLADVRKLTIQRAPCRSGDNCGPNECCLTPGTCQPMGDIISDCDIRQQHTGTKPSPMVTGFRMCPCGYGLICTSISVDFKGICIYGK